MRPAAAGLPDAPQVAGDDDGLGVAGGDELGGRRRPGDLLVAVGLFLLRWLPLRGDGERRFLLAPRPPRLGGVERALPT
jgi:hypothetical protein